MIYFILFFINLKAMVKLLQNYKAIQWILFTIACVIYSNTIFNKWAIDDGIVIYQNKNVQNGISGIPKIISSDAFSGFYGEDINAVAGGRYRPLSQVFFALNVEFFFKTDNQKSLDTSPGEAKNQINVNQRSSKLPNVLHFFNILWYGLLCLVIYRTLLLLLCYKGKEFDFKTYFLSFVTTLIYTVHPLHTEAVANIKGLDEILAMFGCMVSLYCILKSHHLVVISSANNIKWLLGAIISYFLALLSKESAITFVVVIPLALYFFTDASLKSIFKLTLPLIIPLLLFLGIRQAVLYQPNKAPIAEELMNNPFLILASNAQYAPLIKGSSINKLVNPNANTFTKMPYINELATNFYTYGVYLKLLFIPTSLTVDYYPRHIEVKSFSNISVILSFLIHISLLLWGLVNIRKRKIIAFGILYYFITFSIVSNLLFPIGTNMAERFMFIPSLGFCLIVACLFFEFGKKLSNSYNSFSKIFIGLTIVAMLYSAQTFSRNFDWKDNYTLFSKDIKVSQNSGKINTDLAAEYINNALLTNENNNNSLLASESERVEIFLNAIPLLIKALEIHPMSNLAWLKMANAHHFLGQIETNDSKLNLNYLQTALAAYNEAYFYRGKGMEKDILRFKAICLMDLGKLEGQKFGNIPIAISYLEQAKKLAPNESEIYLLLGTAHSINNNFEMAIFNTKKAVDLNPNNTETKQNLAVAYQQFAYANSSKKGLLLEAEKLLLEVYSMEKKLDVSDLKKTESMLRTLDLLYRNYKIQGNAAKQNLFKTEILKLNPKAFTNKNQINEHY